MKQFVITWLPWLLSAITIWMTLLAGNKHPSAWAIGLGNQALWLAWIVVTGAWGLLPMNLALWVLYARNHWKWKAEPLKATTAEAGERAVVSTEEIEGASRDVIRVYDAGVMVHMTVGPPLKWAP